MNRYASREAEKKTEFRQNLVTQKKRSRQAALSFADRRPEGVILRKQQEMMSNSPRLEGLIHHQAVINHSAIDEIEPIQKKENQTGLPDDLKSGIEHLSGYSMDDVNVHRNSSQPAQLQAHAYAEGTEIYLAPGQEKHLPHEAWHVVQQKQGRVKPTMQLKGSININDDDHLEKEADVMGAFALQSKTTNTLDSPKMPIQAKVIQRRIPTMSPEFITTNKDMAVEILIHTIQNLTTEEQINLIQSTVSPLEWDIPSIVSALEEGNEETVLGWYTLIDGVTPQSKHYEEEPSDPTMATEEESQAIMGQLDSICDVISGLIANEDLLARIFGPIDLDYPQSVLQGIHDALMLYAAEGQCPVRILGNEAHNEWVGVEAVATEGASQVDLTQSSFQGLVDGEPRAIATLIHELSHAVAGTKDYAYDRAGSLKLGPKKRIRNAETYAHAWLSQNGQEKDWYFYDAEKSVGKRAARSGGGQESGLAQIRKKKFGEVINVIVEVWNNVDNAYLRAKEVLQEKKTGIETMSAEQRSVKELMMRYALMPHEPEYSAENADVILALIEDRTKALNHVKKDLKRIIKTYNQIELEELEPVALLAEIMKDELRMTAEMSELWVRAFYDPANYMIG